MADEFSLEAVIEFHAKGQREAEAAIARTQRALDELHKTGKITSEQHEKLGTEVTKYGAATRRVAERDIAKQLVGTQSVSKATKQLSEGDLPRLRYALYDVASTYRTVAIAAAGLVTATTAIAAAHESAFSAVERTTLQASGALSNNIGQIKDELYDLSTTIPVAFTELSRIASLGAQLGIDDSDLAKFTDTVAKFSSTTNVTVEETALAFGRLSNLANVAAKDFDRMGSAIALAGVDSAATETEILAVAQNIAAVASAAGLSAQEILALSTTFASLRTAPELSRSVTQQFFGQLNRAVADGGERLTNFAIITGKTEAQIAQMVNSGSGFMVLNDVLNGIAKFSGPQVTEALDALGLASLRTEQGIQRLRQNTDLLARDLDNINKGWGEGQFLDQAFARVVEDAASQLIILSNAFQEFVAAAGEPTLNLIKEIVPELVNMLKGFTDFAKSDFGKRFFDITTRLTAMVAAVAVVRAALYLAQASMVAFTTVGIQLAGVGRGIWGLATALTGVGTAAQGATSRVTLLKSALWGLGRATVIFGAIQAGIELLFNFSGVVEQAQGPLRFMADALSGVGSVASGVFFALRDLQNAVARFFGDATNQAGRFYNFIGNILNNLSPLMDAGIKRITGQGAATKNLTRMTKGAVAPTDAWAEALDGLGSSAGGATKEVRTLVDYANDLLGVFNRSFDIRFKAGLQMDEVANSWEDLSKRIRDARIELQGLTADRAIKEYFLGVAINYGDNLRADKLRAELAELNEKIAETQAEASTELNANTKAGRNNRKTLSGIVSQYQEYIAALAESGADQATLNRAVDQAEQEFRSQASALGYANSQITPYVTQIRSMITAINSIPRNITVGFNADPMLQALNEFVAKAQQAAAAAGAGIAKGIGDGAAKGARALEIEAKIIHLQGQLGQYAGTAYGQRILDSIAGYRALLNSGSFASGGYTGRGGKYEPAGIVHRGEYVIPKEQVNQRTGLPYASALGQMQSGTKAPRSSYASGGFVSGDGLAVVDLSARSMRALNRPVYVQLNGKIVAEAVYGNSEAQSLRGSN